MTSSAVVIDKLILLWKAIIDREASAFFKITKPVVRFITSVWISSFHPYLQPAFPQDVDGVILLHGAQDAITFVKDLRSHQINYLVYRVNFQTSKVWNVVDELSSLYHIFIIVHFHVFNNAIIYSRKLIFYNLQRPFWKRLKYATFISNHTARSFEIGK